jgi:hypothetical protein
MSEMNHAPLWYPPQFPEQGRLPTAPHHVQQNISQHSQLESDYQDSLSVAAGQRVPMPCCKTLHITLCFDGTGNNLNQDLYLANPRHPTNVARMFRASIGDGIAGGTGHNAKVSGLVDAEGVGYGQYYKYYMPGVGTPFAEIGDLEYGVLGQVGGAYGEQRINWALLMIVDALRRVLKQPRLDNAALLAAVESMGTVPAMGWVNGERLRRREFEKQLRLISRPLRIALSQPSPGHPKLLGIKLYVYGFSRGAAAARAFVSWLNGLLSVSATTPSLACLEMELPISVDYLGLLDTVAAVGLGDIVPGVDGHMGWADGNQQLPDNGLVKRCLHIVAGHEQRLSFPLESIRREGGGYPVNSVEMVYPGVHSDQGGGYPAGDQGKAVGENDGLLLSQIALNDMYADAFAHGAPLKVPKESLPFEMNKDLWRAMEFALVKEFDVSPTLVNRFNAWRLVTLGLIPAKQPLPIERAEHLEPLIAPVSIEQAMRDQMAWLTAWRIDRYAFGSLKQTPFYLAATDTHTDPALRQADEALRNAQQRAISTRRKEQLAREHMLRQPKVPLEPGLPGFDPDIARTQLGEAAAEFDAEYRGPGVLANAANRVARSGLAQGYIAHAVTAAARAERERMRQSGLDKLHQLFPRPKNTYAYRDENTRGDIDESLNANEPEGLLRALFDDQVHDSRAWFLHALRRETGASYFCERMIFFGDATRRDLALYGEDGTLMVAGTLIPSGTEPPRPTVMDAERRAQIREEIKATWDAHDVKAKGGGDVLV